MTQRTFSQKARLVGVLGFVLTACAAGEETSSSPEQSTHERSPDWTFNDVPRTLDGVCKKPGVLIRSTTCSADDFGGRARVLGADVVGLVDVDLVDTGPLPASGGSLSEALLTVNVPGLLTATVAGAKVEGKPSTTTSFATVADVRAFIAGLHISADVLRADSRAMCGGSSGTSTIVNLSIGGIHVTVDGSPNEKVWITGLVEIIVNEQLSVPGGLRVNALHVRAPGVDVVISSATSAIECTCANDDAGGGGSDAGQAGDACDDGGTNGNDAGTIGGGTGDDDCEECNAHGGVGKHDDKDHDRRHGHEGDKCDDKHPCLEGLLCSHGSW